VSQPKSKPELTENLLRRPEIPMENATLRIKKASKTKSWRTLTGSYVDMNPEKAQRMYAATSPSVQAFLRPRETMSAAESARRQRRRDEERKARESGDNA